MKLHHIMYIETLEIVTETWHIQKVCSYSRLLQIFNFIRRPWKRLPLTGGVQSDVRRLKRTEVQFVKYL